MKHIIASCLIVVVGLMSLVTALAQDAPTETPVTQPLLESTAELLPTVEISPVIDITATPVSQVTAETTLGPEPTLQVTLSETAAAMMTQTPQTVILIPADGSVSTIPAQTLVPTATPTVELRSITGQALYPNHVTGQAFIQVQAFAPDNTLIASAITDARGNYVLTIPANQVTRVEIGAALHLDETLYLAPGVTPVLVILRAGDLDGDGCVGAADINLLTISYGQAFSGADIDGNGVVDVIDLTLLSGNYDGDCEAPTETATPLPAVPSATIEVIGTAVVILTEEPAVPTALPATEVIPTVEVTAVPEIPTETPLPSPTTESLPVPVEPTAEATAQL